MNRSTETDLLHFFSFYISKQSEAFTRIRARFHCGKQNAKRCVSMTVARQICIFEYGVSLSGKRELKRAQTKTGSPKEGGGGGGERFTQT